MFLDYDPIPMDKFVLNTEAHPFPIFEWTAAEKEANGRSQSRKAELLGVKDRIYKTMMRCAEKILDLPKSLGKISGRVLIDEEWIGYLEEIFNEGVETLYKKCCVKYANQPADIMKEV